MTIRLSQTQTYISEKWPNLTENNATVISCDDALYNCAAFIVGDKTQRWWPVETEVAEIGVQGYYWPPCFPCEESVKNIIATLRGVLGFERCADGTLESGYEKIAIYGVKDEPRHLAKQLPNGKWASKLGELEDIEHDTLDALNGWFYGTAIAFLRRQRQDAKDKSKT